MAEKPQLKIGGKLVKSLTHKELQKELDRQGIPYPKGASKDRLSNILAIGLQFQKLKSEYTPGKDNALEGLDPKILRHPQVQRYLKDKERLIKEQAEYREKIKREREKGNMMNPLTSEIEDTQTMVHDLAGKAINQDSNKSGHGLQRDKTYDKSHSVGKGLRSSDYRVYDSDESLDGFDHSSGTRDQIENVINLLDLDENDQRPCNNDQGLYKNNQSLHKTTPATGRFNNKSSRLLPPQNSVLLQNNHTDSSNSESSPSTGVYDPVTPAAGFYDPVTPTTGFYERVTPSAGNNEPASPSAGFYEPTTPSAGFSEPTTPSARFYEPTTPTGFSESATLSTGVSESTQSTGFGVPAFQTTKTEDEESLYHAEKRKAEKEAETSDSSTDSSSNSSSDSSSDTSTD